MTAAAGAEKRPDLKFFAVVDHAVAEGFWYSLNGFIDVSHSDRLIN